MRWSWFLVLGTAGAIAYASVPEGFAQKAVYILVAALCGLVFLLFGRHRVIANKRSWRYLMAGFAAWVLGDTIAGVYLFDSPVVPMVSTADIAYLLGNVAFAVGILVFEDESGRVVRTEDVLEALIVALGVGLTAWIFVIGNKVDESLNFDAFMQYWPVVAYTVGDGFVLALLLGLLLFKRARTVPFVLVGLAFVSFTVSGWFSYVTMDALDVRDASKIGAGWLLGYVFLASASLHPQHRLWPGASVPRRVVDRARLLGLSAAILMSPGVMAVQLSRGVPVGDWGWVVLASSVAVLALVAARMACFLTLLRKQAAALSVAAVSDPVTGLANRRHLGDLLDASLLTAGKDGVVVFIVDIDRFAQINETFGYPVGDRVLREIGQRLVSAATGDTVVGRLGGDQFAVSVASARMLTTPVESAEHFRSAVSRTMFVRDINVALDVTVGVAQSSDLVGAHSDTRSGGENGAVVDADALLQHAHVALTAAKHGHAPVSVYRHSIDIDRHEQMRLLGELETALRERQLRVFFQPCLDLKSGRVSGVEALLRWQHPREGIIAPWSFLPDAERTGMLPAITEYVLEDALDCCGRIRRTRDDFTMSVNLSVRNLIDQSLVDLVASTLQRHDVPASAVEFEVTETTAMTDPRRAVDSLVSLRDLGVSVAIDDYGTGYSSLAYLRALPVQTLKIDKSFVTAMNSQPVNASIVSSTIDLAQSLGMRVVAEGVEDLSTLDRLRALGCDGAQGFHIGHPVPLSELEALIEQIECASKARGADGTIGPVAQRIEG